MKRKNGGVVRKKGKMGFYFGKGKEKAGVREGKEMLKMRNE